MRINTPKTIEVTHPNGLPETFFYYSQGSFNYIYVNNAKTFIFKFSKNNFNALSSVDKEYVAMTDAPERMTQLWNVHVRPLLQKIADDNELPSTHSTRTFAFVCWADSNNLKLKGTLSAFIPQDKVENNIVKLTGNQINTFILDTYRGYPELNIPGGRILADTTILNVFSYYGKAIPIDLGSFFALNQVKELRREFSEDSLIAWEKTPSCSPQKKRYDRITDYRDWYIARLDEIKKNPLITDEFQSTYLLLSAVIYLSMKKPAYLDLTLLRWNTQLKEICAYLFLSSEDENAWLSKKIIEKFLPNLTTLTKENMLEIIEANFPDISTCSFYEEAPTLPYVEIIAKLTYESDLQKRFLMAKSALVNINNELIMIQLNSASFTSGFSSNVLDAEKRLITQLNLALENIDHVQHLPFLELPIPPLKIRDILKKYLDELKALQNLICPNVPTPAFSL